MSVEKVNKRKAEKKNRKRNEISRKRKQQITFIVCLALAALMVISPALIYVADIANRSQNEGTSPQTPIASGSNIQITDENGNVIGYMDNDGNIQYFDNATVATGSNAEENTEAIYDDAGNEIGHRHADGTEHLD